MAENMPEQWLTQQVSTSAEFVFDFNDEKILESEQILRLTASITLLKREITRSLNGAKKIASDLTATKANGMLVTD